MEVGICHLSSISFSAVWPGFTYTLSDLGVRGKRKAATVSE